MSAYPKTENLLARDPESHRLLLGMSRHRAYEQISEWLVTEKIDGTNIRLQLSWHGPMTGPPLPRGQVLGRTDAATLPKMFATEALGLTLGEEDVLGAKLFEALKAITPKLTLLEDGTVDTTGSIRLPEMTVYGEGYGPGIQKGGGYTDKKSLRIFDIVTHAGFDDPYWRPWEDVQKVAAVLGLSTAPLIGTRMSTEQIVRLVKTGIPSIVSLEESGSDEVISEGVVARTDPYLFTSRKQRVMFKLKTKDVAEALEFDPARFA